MRMFSRSFCDYACVAEKNVVVTAPSNIAVVKYWGKEDHMYNHPLNPSISVSLSDLITTTSIYASDQFEDHSLKLNGLETGVSDRLRSLIQFVSEYGNANDLFFRIESTNNFPTAAGLASSASGFGSIAFGLCEIVGLDDPIFCSCAARIGSGSACRSVYGGWVKWVLDENEANPFFSSYGIPLFDENHWSDMQILVVVLESDAKTIPSSIGMKKSVENCELLGSRVTDFVPGIIDDMERAIEEKDAETFLALMMEDCENFHDVCLHTTPCLDYRNANSLRVCEIIRNFNMDYNRVSVGYTFDAGPNAIIFCENKAVLDNFQQYTDEILSREEDEAFLSGIIHNVIGSGPQVLKKNF